MPKLILSSGQELSCRAYVQNGICFDGSFSNARSVDEILKTDDPVRIVTDHGDTQLIDLSGFVYTGNVIVSADSTFTAEIAQKDTVVTREDMQYINIAKILLGEEGGPEE